MPDKARVLLDTDANNEIDDQHAIAYLLLNGEAFVVEGLTVNRTNNGGDIEEQAKEAERVIRLCNLHPQLPVTRGASGSFDDIALCVDDPVYDGKDAVNLIIERAHATQADKLILLAIGKLTNIALALKKDPDIIDRVRVVWLGSNYPDPGEYNLDNDEPSVNFVLDTDVEFEMAVVRYFSDTGTSAVRVTLDDVVENVAGKGPQASSPVTGRNGGEFSNFGDYSVNLLENVRMSGTPPSRALYDMAVAAIVKNPGWASARSIPAPTYVDGAWLERPENPRQILVWENFDKQAIIDDFYSTLSDYCVADVVPFSNSSTRTR